MASAVARRSMGPEYDPGSSLSVFRRVLGGVFPRVIRFLLLNIGIARDGLIEALNEETER